MKNLKNLSSLVLPFLLVACSSGDKQPSAAVKAAFDQRFAAATDVEWEMESATEWEAEFKLNGKEYSANFNADGKWMETEYEVTEADVPAAVKASLDTSFPGYEMEEIEVSEGPDGKAYEFALEKDEDNLEVLISPAGVILKTETVKEGDEDADDKE